MLVEQGEIDQKYSNLKKCIGINLLDFNYIDQTEEFHTIWHIREDSEHIKYTDTVEWHVVELPKLPSIPDGTDLYKWVQFLKVETDDGRAEGKQEGKAEGKQERNSELIAKWRAKGMTDEEINILLN